MATFTGFSDEAIELYEALAADNTREFWAAHKAVWETEVRDQFIALTGALEDEFGPAKLFRPHRDTRFSKDKTPYKTHQAALVGETTGIGWYLQLSAAGLLVGGGWRAHDPGQVARYRAAVDEDGAGGQLAGIVSSLRGSGFDVEGDELRTRPRGFPADHPRLDLLRFRSLMVSRAFGAPDWLATPRALGVVRDTWREVTPLATWCAAHVAETSTR